MARGEKGGGELGVRWGLPLPSSDLRVEGKLTLWCALICQSCPKKQQRLGGHLLGPTTPSNSRRDGLWEPGLRKHSCGKTTTLQVRHEAQLPGKGHRNSNRDKSPCSIVPRIPNLKIPLDPSINTCFAIPNVDSCEPVLVKAEQGLETKVMFGSATGMPSLGVLSLHVAPNYVKGYWKSQQ